MDTLTDDLMDNLMDGFMDGIFCGEVGSNGWHGSSVGNNGWLVWEGTLDAMASRRAAPLRNIVF